MTITIDKADKIFFPEAGFTKGDLANYYRRIAPIMQRYVAERPVTLHRFPDGIAGTPQFIQKSVADHYPDWIARVRVATEDDAIIQPVIDSADTLVYFADQGAIVFHVPLARAGALDKPDRLIFDLDPPDDGTDFAPVVAAARAVRKALADVGLVSYVMTTGSSGLHVAVPLDASVGFDRVRGFAQKMAEAIATDHPDDFTTAHSRDKRRGRLYLDVARNAQNQTGVAPYSVRAKPGAPITTPLAWHELGDTDLGPRRWHIGNIFRRLGQRDCPWADIDNHRQRIDKAIAQSV